MPKVTISQYPTEGIGLYDLDFEHAGKLFSVNNSSVKALQNGGIVQVTVLEGVIYLLPLGYGALLKRDLLMAGPILTELPEGTTITYSRG